METIPLSVRTLYADLVQQVHAGSPDFGSVYTQTIKGAAYLYANRTVGIARRHKFLGRADDPQAQARAAAIRAESRLVAERRRTVRILRSQGLPAPGTDLGRVLDVLADAGLFDEAVLVGTAAYQCYSPLVGRLLPSASLMTQDADIATPSLTLAAAGEADSFETILKRADKTFRPVPGLDLRAPPARFRNASGFLVDLLAPKLRRSDERPLPLEQLGAAATPLQHLRWLLESPVQAVALHGAGVGIKVPMPARYAVHKLIIAQKREGASSKRAKDLVQAGALVDALRDSDPWALADALDDARSQGRDGWRRPLERSLRELNIDLELGPETG